MCFLSFSRVRKLLFFVVLPLLTAVCGRAQPLESISFSLTLPDGRSGGIQSSTTITNIVQRPEGIYVLTERDGCYLLSDREDRPHSLLARPTDRSEHFNTLLEQDREVHLLVNYKSLRPLVHPEEEAFSFTSSFFARTVNPTAIHYAKDGRIMVGSMADGLFVFSPDSSGRYAKVPRRISTVGGQLPSNVIHALYEDERGVIWVGTERGLATLTQDTVYNLGASPPVNLNRWQRFWGIEGPPPLYGGPVRALAEWDDSIVFAGNNGLFRVPCRPDSLALVDEYNWEDRLSEPLEDVKQLLVDLNGNLWVAANQLVRFSVKHDELRVYGRSSGLRGQGVRSLLEDVETGRLWIGTQRGGLYRMHNEGYSDVNNR